MTYQKQIYAATASPILNNYNNLNNNYSNNNNYYNNISDVNINEENIQINCNNNEIENNNKLECQVPFEYIDINGNADFSFLKFTKRSEFRNYLKKAYNTTSLFDYNFKFNCYIYLSTIKYYYNLIEDDYQIKQKLKYDTFLILT